MVKGVRTAVHKSEASVGCVIDKEFARELVCYHTTCL